MIEITHNTLCEAFLKVHNTKMYTFIEDANVEINILPEDFKAKVMKILHYMQERGVKPGDEVIFQIKSNIDFAYIFWACLLGRFVAVPYNYLETERDKSKLIKIWSSLKRPFLATDRTSYEKYKEYIYKNNLINDFNNITEKTIITEEMDQSDENAEIVFPVESDIAYVQFSSGSTSDPKGIILTHKNIISSVRGIIKSLDISREDIFLSWLPFTHNFGLIGNFIVPLISGLEYYIMPTNLFVANPLFWLKKLNEHKVTISAAPNFALKHVCKYLNIQKDIDIDLSPLRVLLNGAEPVSAKVCYEFINKVAIYGMKDTVIRPSYGMTEATYGITTPRIPKKIKEVNIIRNKINIGEKIIEGKIENDDVVSFVEVGSSIDCEIKIVDNDGKEVDDEVVGIILVRGDNVATEYYCNAEIRKITDEDGWLNTGDVGFLRNGNLIITGRAKDIIFVKGANYYSHDIENICEQVNDGDFGKVAVCGIYSHKVKEDQVFCFVEYTGNSTKFDKISLKLKQYIIKKIGIGIAGVIPIKQIPVTISGKIQRNMLLKQFEKMDLYGKNRNIT